MTVLGHAVLYSRIKNEKTLRLRGLRCSGTQSDDLIVTKPLARFRHTSISLAGGFASITRAELRRWLQSRRGHSKEGSLPRSRFGPLFLPGHRILEPSTR